MNTHKQIQQIAATDELLEQAIAYIPICKSKDPNHLKRRQHQRAITNDMIRVAIAYGSKDYSYGAVGFTLTDRNLSQSPYVKLTNSLRGLRVVCYPTDNVIQIITTYWSTKTKQRVR